MINLENKQAADIPAGMVQLAAGKTLDTCGKVDADLSIVIGNDKDVQELNNRYLGIDAPTDVLSFTAGEMDPETGRVYLGDVIISLPRAAAQASRRGHSTNDELQLLVIHGVLHLLGYDHDDPVRKSQMWSLQGNILADLGLNINITEE